jgi:hypothetical protein
MEDYDEEGTLPLSVFKEAIDNLDLNLNEEMYDYILFIMYKKSDSIDKLNYSVLLELLETK